MSDQHIGERPAFTGPVTDTTELPLAVGGSNTLERGTALQLKNYIGATGGATNLAYTASPTGGTVTSDTGTDATLPLADGTNAGLMAPAQHSKLAGIAAGATAVAVDAAPTDGSSNAVSSNGVFDALAGKADTGHNHSGTYDPAGTASAAMSAHTGAADPHTQYALESALGTAAAKNVGTAAGTVAAGDDARLSDERVPTAAGLAAKTTGATSKATPVDDDEIPAADSAASFGLKKLTWANIKATLKTYFDSLYQSVLVSGTNIKTINSTSLLGSGDITVSTSLDPLKLTDANTVEQYNSTTAQVHRIYNTRTDASNYERLGIGWSANTLTLNAEFGGTGLQRHMGLQTVGGNVGIGTATPSAKLEVTGGARFNTGAHVVMPGGAYFQGSNGYFFGTGGKFGNFTLGYFGQNDLELGATSYLVWGANNNLSSPDAAIYREGVGVLAQRFGTTAQTFRLYNTYTDTSNYEHLAISWASNALTINTEFGGTGLQRHMGLQTVGGNVGIGTPTPTKKLQVEGDVGFNTATSGGLSYDAALNKLTLQAKAGQTANLLEVRKESGAVVLTINGDGTHLAPTFLDPVESLSASGYLEGSGYYIESGWNTESGAAGDVLLQSLASTRRSKKSTTTLRGQPVLGIGGWVNAPGWMHYRGRAPVNADAGAINIGDRLVMSAALDGAVCADNSWDLSLSTVGFALSSKSAGSPGQIEMWVAPVPGMPNLKTSGYTELSEMAAPSAPATNAVRLYAEDNGAGKTRLMARFATGAAQVIAVEP